MALDLGKLMKAVAVSDLIVKPQYERWLLRNPEQFPIPKEIVDQLVVLMTTPPRDRTRSFSSSSAGQCLRKQLLDYLGTVAGKDTVIEPQLARIFQNGTWGHMRTQVNLLMAGIIEEIEVPMRWPKKRTKGSIDGRGVVPDNHPKTHWRGLEFGLEFKTAMSFAYKLNIEEGPGKYLDQVSRYLLVSGLDLFVILMENKDNQELHEWVIEPDPKAINDQKVELNILNKHVDDKTLPDRLPDCQMKKGPVFNGCPYGGKNGACHRLGLTWPTV
jgi:hypothetical protein